MIKFILKAISNPQGALAQAILHLIKESKYGKYVDKPNELDVGLENMINKQTEIQLQIKAMQSIIRDFDKKDEIDKIKKELSKFKKIKSL